MSKTSEIQRKLTPFEFNGKRAAWASLEKLLPDVETALFFGRAVNMNWEKLTELLKGLFKTSVLEALTDGQHSTELQGYLVSIAPPEVEIRTQPIDYTDSVPHAEILPYMWEALNIEIAESISKVADTLSGVLDSLPGTQGQMAFQHMMVQNRNRPTIGDYRATIKHPSKGKNLVVFDVSGSVNERTVSTIAADVVALAYKANAGLCLVSNTAKYWDPGSFSVNDVLREAEYGGTHYETLAPLFNQSWDVVVAIADYDSSRDAQRYFGENARGSIEELIDISLVNRHTYLSEVLGMVSKQIKPMLLSNSEYYPIS